MKLLHRQGALLIFTGVSQGTKSIWSHFYNETAAMCAGSQLFQERGGEIWALIKRVERKHRAFDPVMTESLEVLIHPARREREGPSALRVVERGLQVTDLGDYDLSSGRVKPNAREVCNL